MFGKTRKSPSRRDLGELGSCRAEVQGSEHFPGEPGGAFESEGKPAASFALEDRLGPPPLFASSVESILCPLSGSVLHLRALCSAVHPPVQ